jgi:hypothetical protein
VLAKSERKYFEEEKLQRQMRKKSGAKIQGNLQNLRRYPRSVSGSVAGAGGCKGNPM